MSDNPIRLQLLFEKYTRNQLNPAEQQEFWALLRNLDEKDLIDEGLKELWNRERMGMKASDSVNWPRVEERLFTQMEGSELDYERFKVVPFWKKRWVAAAAVLIIVAAGGLAWWSKVKPTAEHTIVVKQDVEPGHNGAVLVLANGQKIILEDKDGNQLSSKGGKTGLVSKDGGITWFADNEQARENGMLTLTTPRKRQYDVVLPDGSHAWLNAESSISYPKFFEGGERKVTITGEVYFEVAKNAAMPFKVSSNGQVIEVLGTHFNVNAYGDEPITRTTLLEGKVRIVKDNRTLMLEPGQMATVSNSANGQMGVHPADTEQVMAWKNGEFSFSDQGVETILRQAAKWYDIDIELETKINQGFTVNVSRDKPLSALLKAMELSGGVHFEIEGRKVLVRP